MSRHTRRIGTPATKGFTLLEIMVVVVILGVLASFVVPRLMHRPEQAKWVKAMADIHSLEESIELYRLDQGFYPTESQGLQALISAPLSPPFPPRWEPYLKRLPHDPWGQPYHYRQPGQHGAFDIYTTSPDGRTLGNWDDTSDQ